MSVASVFICISLALENVVRSPSPRDTGRMRHPGYQFTFHRYSTLSFVDQPEKIQLKELDTDCAEGLCNLKGCSHGRLIINTGQYTFTGAYHQTVTVYHTK